MIDAFELIPYSDTTYDPLILPDGVLNFPGPGRRSQRVALVAGDNYFHDGGSYDSDREATLTATVTLAQAKQIDAMIRAGTVLYFDDDIGVYRCVINSAGATVDSKISMVLWIKERLVSAVDYPAPPTFGWTEKTDNTYWAQGESDSGAWSGSAWQNESDGIGGWYDLYIIPTGGWEVGYFPTKIKITYSSSLIAWLNVLPSTTFVLGNPYVSGTNRDIAPTNDIEGLRIFQTGSQFSVTKIEFYEVS